MKQVVVTGAGPAAVVTAILLKRMGYEVLVVGKARRTSYLEGASPRVAEGLARVGCRQALALLGTRWQRGAAWGGEYREVNGEHVINRRSLDEALLGDLIAAGVDYVDARVRNLSWEGDYWRGTAERNSGQLVEFEAHFLVEARGRSAPKHAPDICVGPLSIALIGSFQGRAGGEARTLTEAFDEGWAWATSDSQGACSLQLIIDHARLNSPLDTLHEQLRPRLSLIPRQLGPLMMAGPVMSRGIQPVLRGGIIERSYLRVGDAAYSCDPLSGHGMYEAISGAFAAAPTINTLLTRPDQEELACRFYRDRAQSLFHQRLSMATEFYRGEMRWPNQVFWRNRQKKLTDVSLDLSSISGSHVVFSPVVEDGLIVEREVLVTTEHPRGVRFIAGIEVVRLLEAIRAVRGKPNIESLAKCFSVAPKQIISALKWLRQESGIVR
jgi:flavin-dependent dehydrogenase